LIQKKTLSCLSNTDLKVANIVILNNTGLPDKDIYFNLINTTPSKFEPTCPPPGDWDKLFQWYGGTVSGTAATQIVLNQPHATTLSYNVPDPTAPDGGWSGVSLADMRGSVLSNASCIVNPPTSSNQWWDDQTYSSLKLNNYPTTDTTVKGQFPTISMGLFGACSGDNLNAGRIAISAFIKYPGDNFDPNAGIPPDPNPAVPPYLLIEGMIFPTDNGTSYHSKASNFDLSFVDQISIAANMELWTLNSTSGFSPVSNGWFDGNSLTTEADSTYEIFANAPTNQGFQTITYKGNDAKDYPLNYAFTHMMVAPASFKNPYSDFLAALITDTTTSLASSTPHPVLRVAGGNAKLGDVPLQEFGDCSYGLQLGYNFSTYFVDMSPPSSSQANWTKILNWYQTDSNTTLTSQPSDPTQYISSDGNTEHMLMLGTFLSGSDCSLSPFPLTVNNGLGGGPLSIQLSSLNNITICDASTSGQCGGAIQTLGLPTGPIGGIFGNTNTLSGPLGINFYVNQPDYILKEFDLSVGKTIAGQVGTLEVDLVNASTSTNLVRVSITLPVTTNEGSASSVVTAPNTYSSGFATAGATGWPLQIDWESCTCKYNGTQLSTTASAFSYWDIPTSNWVPTTNLNASYIAACTLTQSTTATAYKLNIKGDNLTVALTQGAPVPNPVGSAIGSGTQPGNNDRYTNGNTSSGEISSTSNGLLLNQITLALAKNATSFLHLLAVTKGDLLKVTGLAGNNPQYRLLRWNTNKSPAIWEEAFGTGSANASTAYWPACTTECGNGAALCSPTTLTHTVGSPNIPKSSEPAPTTSGILNNISSKCLGDVSVAFSFGMVNSPKLGSDFTTTAWPAAPFPPNSTAIGALTTQEYFQLIGSQTANDGSLPVGKNLTDSTNIFLTYDPYVDLGFNKALSNCYFSGFSDRCSSYGGLFNVNPTFLMDFNDSTSGKLRLGNVPGIEPTNNTVIVITLHPILRPTTTDTIDSDLDNDFDTDSVDMSLMLLAFGECPPAPQTCPEDLNKDGVVDNADFGLLLINFTN